MFVCFLLVTLLIGIFGERTALQGRETAPQPLVMLSEVRGNPELVEGDSFSNAGHLCAANNNFSSIKPEPAERRVLSSSIFSVLTHVLKSPGRNPVGINKITRVIFPEHIFVIDC